MTRSSKRMGLCMPLALSGIREIEREQPQAVLQLVHGKMTVASGERITHAWVEKDGSQVWEPVFEKWWDREYYYLMHDVEAIAVYTSEEAMFLPLVSGNSGPWTEDEVAEARERVQAMQLRIASKRRRRKRP